MLINRLYKTKNTQNLGKPIVKNEDDTKLLFYVHLFEILANSQEIFQGQRRRAQTAHASQNHSWQETELGGRQ